MTPIEILNAIENNEKVSRWIVFRNRTELLSIIDGYSEDTKHQINFLIDSAQESL
jgi:hypothetical protein